MARIFDLFCLTILFLTTVTAAAAQGANQTSDEKCDGPVYQAKEVSQKAKITSKPIPTYTEAARKHNVNGQVALTAVLCRSGHVTDIQVVKGLSYGLTEAAIATAKQIKFEPAQKDGEIVSQTMQFEYSFNLSPTRRALAKEPVEGRIVERTALNGTPCPYRLEVSKEIWAKIKTRSGSPYHNEQGNLDLEAILTLGYFDQKQSHLRLEEGEKGGIYVVFVLKGLSEKDLCDK